MLESIKELVRELNNRVKNPIILSFILLWLYFHWRLLYMVVEMDNGVSLTEKLSRIDSYITINGNWRGMVLKPLGWSFVSLIIFYLIAVVSQAIRVYGRMLYAFVLQKVDTDAFVLKEEYAELKQRNMKLSNELIHAKDELARFINENGTLKQQLETLRNGYEKMTLDLNQIKETSNTNRNFIKNMSSTLLYFLNKSGNINAKIVPEGFELNLFSIIAGSWRGLINEHRFEEDTGVANNFSIDNNQVFNHDGKVIGEIRNLKFSQQYRYLYFEVFKKNETQADKYHLILRNSDEYIGYVNENYLILKRNK